ncbi:hypothetical protein AB6813_02120 [bacterium RCC_150]
MEGGAGRAGNKYDWQSCPPDSLDGMPPKRRRLVVWGMLWFYVLGAIVAGVVHFLGVPEPWQTLLVAIVIAVVFWRLVKGAAVEERQLRAEGIELPEIFTTRKSLLLNGALILTLWVAYGVAAWMTHALVVPLLPVVGTMLVIYQYTRWRNQ